MFGRRSPLRLVTFASLAGFATLWATASPRDCNCAVEQAPDRSGPTQAPVVHDPVIAKDGSTYVLFATGRGVSFRTSTDLKNWNAEQKVFATPPAWAPQTIVGFKDHIWAPDVSYFGGKWHLYYSISTFGKNRSAIGHATSKSLDHASPNFDWVDQGPVIESQSSDDFNAIDPNVVLDEKGTPWLSFGSFWNGLRLVKLDLTGKRADLAKPLSIAARPHEGPDQPGAIEAPTIVRHGKYFYLFASYDFCCRGAKSTYNVRVGRSTRVQGPYLDRAGKKLTEGGGTSVVVGTERWKGPGHQAILTEAGKESLIYHAYDAEDRGTPKLRISPLEWDAQGWPKPASPDQAKP